MYYSAEQLITMAKRAEGFTHIPTDYWNLYVRKNLDDQKPNEFNDVHYLMKGEEIVMDQTCTTVPGLPALKGGYKKYNKHGAAIIASNIWMYDAFKSGLHNGKMKCLRQVKPIFIYRDGDMDNKPEQIGPRVKGKWATNIHSVTYNLAYNAIKKLVLKLIGEWSYGCLVHNNVAGYVHFLDIVGDQEISTLILDEFSV